MPSGNTSNKTLLYSYLSPSGATINVYNDGTETVSPMRLPGR